MDSEYWKKINEVFSAWLDLDADKRGAFLDEACGNNEAFRQEVQALIDAHLQTYHFVETPVLEYASIAMAGENDALESDQQFGSYKIIKEIGRGGMGAVYLAARADEEYQKQVAVKLIKRGMDTEQVLHRFRNERQILATFDHPNIARLLEGGSTSTGLPYFVMEYVEGRPIDLYCDENNLNVTGRLEIFRQVCAAVSYAHRNLVVHRDIKPGNILITSEGLPKLLDFGIAKILHPHTQDMTTGTGFVPMTPEYASPEQALGGQVTTFSDIYSLGILLYELLTGHLPYRLQGTPPMEIARVITETRPQLPSAIVNTAAEGLSPESVSKKREGTPDRLRRRLRGDLDNIIMMALRKEPNRRYQSVDQLSEDIRRHLEGHPVIARKDTFLYRTTKFVLRNKIAAVFAVLALLAIGIAGAIRWRTNLQAASFQEFGQEAARMEAIMRYAYLLPLHDTQQEQKRVLERMDLIRKRMQTLGGAASGPGYYSIGRGYAALHRYQEARDHLVRAWTEHGYQHAPVANALGLTLAMLYEEKLREARWLYDKEQFAIQKVQLEKQYRDPALQYIQYGAAASEDPEFVQALIAFLETRYDEALKQAQVVERKTSWLYEAKLLQGHVYTAMGNDQREIGKGDLAAGFYEKAKLAYLEASQKGESDPQVYEGLCGMQSEVQELQVSQKGASSESLVKEGISYCQKALKADSANINANLFSSIIYSDFAYAQYLHGIDCAAATEKAADYARAVLKMQPENGLAHQALGNAYKTLASAKSQWAENPEHYLNLAGASLEKALTIMPQNPELLSNLGANSINLALYYHSKGQDHNPSLNRAIDCLNQAVDQSPRNSRYHSNLGIAYSYKGAYERDSGVDPRESLKQSIAHLKKSVEINPAFVHAYIWGGITTLILANAQTDYGEDALPAIDESIQLRKKVLTLDPANTYAYMGLGATFMEKARLLMAQGKDPTAELQASREGYQKSLDLNKKIAMTYRGSAEVEMLAARNAMKHNQSPEAFLEEADRFLKAGSALNPDSTDFLDYIAQLHLTRAEHLLNSGKPAETEIRQGIRAADRLLQYNPKSENAIIFRGQLYLLQATTLPGASRVKAAKEAVASLDQAFRMYPQSRKRYEKEYQSATRLAQENL